jgi:hypothetical protein
MPKSRTFQAAPEAFDGALWSFGHAEACLL